MFSTWANGESWLLSEDDPTVDVARPLVVLPFEGELVVEPVCCKSLKIDCDSCWRVCLLSPRIVYRHSSRDFTDDFTGGPNFTAIVVEWQIVECVQPQHSCAAESPAPQPSADMRRVWAEHEVEASRIIRCRGADCHAAATPAPNT